MYGSYKNYYLKRTKSQNRLGHYKSLLLEGFSKLSELSRYNRFHSLKKILSKEELTYFLDIDNYNHLAIGIIARIKDKDFGIAIIRYIRDKNFPQLAEVTLAIIDSYQSKGLGTTLYKQILIHAKKNNIKTLTHYVLNENKGMIKLLKKFDAVLIQEAYGITKIMV